MNTLNKKILVILGPTASGKTGLAVQLADKYNGEIISADSRQVYKYMDIGSGKDLAEYENNGNKIKYHLIDVCHPKLEYNLAKFVNAAEKAIADILKRNKLPIIAGGSGLYLQALVSGYNLNNIKPDKKFRKELEKLKVEELYHKLEKTNPKFAQSLNESDSKNKRRLIRYLEVASQKTSIEFKKSKEYDCLVLGLNPEKDILHKKIYKRLIERLEKEDMVKEVETLHDKHALSWKRLEDFGLEYKFISYYLQEKLEYDEMVEKLFIATRQFAKKQMTWFRRWERQGININWIKEKNEADILLRKFLK